MREHEASAAVNYVSTNNAPNTVLRRRVLGGAKTCACISEAEKYVVALPSNSFAWLWNY